MATTEKQRAANRRNAQLSTGPKTPEGKAISSNNALKHGLLARNTVLAPSEFLALLAAYEAECAPVGPTEQFLAEQLAILQWRLLRASRIAQGFTARLVDLARDPAAANDPPGDSTPGGLEAREYAETTRALGFALSHFPLAHQGINALTRYENTLHRAFFNTRDELLQCRMLREKKMRNKPIDQEPEPPQQLNPDPPLREPAPVTPKPKPAAPKEVRRQCRSRRQPHRGQAVPPDPRPASGRRVRRPSAYRPGTRRM